jgi:hypothetical protein
MLIRVTNILIVMIIPVRRPVQQKKVQEAILIAVASHVQVDVLLDVKNCRKMENTDV